MSVAPVTPTTKAFMRLVSKIFNWYFRKSTLPYWCVVLFDLFACFLAGLFMVWLRHSSIEMMNNCAPLIHSFLIFAVANVIGYRIFHTYSGILRYSQFVDLMRVMYAQGLSFILAFLFNCCVVHLQWDSAFYPFTGRMLIAIYLGSMIVMCVSRVFIKLLYDHALISNSAERTLIYGTRSGAIMLTNEARNNKPVRFLIEGYIGDVADNTPERLMGKRIYANNDKLGEVIRRHNIRVVMVSPLKHDQFVANQKMQDALMEAGVKIYIAQNAREWNENNENQGKVTMREVNIEDLLPRDQIQVDLDKVAAMLKNRRVMITGSAGSIGSELVRQVASFGPAEMMLIDMAETPQHDIRLMMRKDYPEVKMQAIVTNICKEQRMEEIMRDFRPDVVFHAAAYKHVPMMEDNPSESVQNNVWGTKIIADLSVKYNVKKFVMVSTDKAVNPTNVMGCSKRICEIYVHSLDKAIKDGKVKGVTQFITTRFGNVLGSNGSVIPLFRKQLAAGGPLTVTHPKIIRFFMLIPEACKLVLEAGTHGNGGEIFVFDMGEPVRIADLAKRMIMLSGAKNVGIKYVGLREGEKLYEEVLNENENTLPSFHEKIRIAMVRNYEYEEAERQVEELNAISMNYDDMGTVRKMKEIVPEYISKHSRYEVLDKHEETEEKKSETAEQKNKTTENDEKQA